MRSFQSLAIALTLCGLALPGCAGDELPSDFAEDAEGVGQGSDDEDLDLEAGEAEEIGTTADSAEQPLAVRGCDFRATIGRSPSGAIAIGSFICSPGRWVYVGVCVDRYESGRWVAKACTGARRLWARSSSFKALTSSAYPGSGYLRARIRIDGYGTAVSPSVRY
jgi:hypothetical protein